MFPVVAGAGEVRCVLHILHLNTVLALYPQLDLALLAPHPGGVGLQADWHVAREGTDCLQSDWDLRPAGGCQGRRYARR